MRGQLREERAGQCPARRNERTITSDTKSRAGRRVIGLPPPLVELLRQHQAEQNAERFAAAQLWQEDGWIFASPTGQPINLRTDNKHWKNLLTEAGVRDVRLHDARHTAATVLLLLGVPERAVMGIMGWSNSSMAARYQHLTAVIQDDIAARVGGLLWASMRLQMSLRAIMTHRPRTTSGCLRWSGWRKRRDSNPRSLAGRSLSRRVHSAALPRFRLAA